MCLSFTGYYEPILLSSIACVRLGWYIIDIVGLDLALISIMSGACASIVA